MMVRSISIHCISLPTTKYLQFHSLRSRQPVNQFDRWENVFFKGQGGIRYFALSCRTPTRRRSCLGSIKVPFFAWFKSILYSFAANHVLLFVTLQMEVVDDKKNQRAGLGWAVDDRRQMSSSVVLLWKVHKVLWWFTTLTRLLILAPFAALHPLLWWPKTIINDDNPTYIHTPV